MTLSERETQLDRTRLAWRRTSISATVVGLLATREILLGLRGAAALTAVATVLLIWGAAVALGQRRVMQLARGGTRPGWAPLALVAVLVTLVLVLVVLGWRLADVTAA